MTSIFGMNNVEESGGSDSSGSVADEIVPFWATTFKRQILIMCESRPSPISSNCKIRLATLEADFSFFPIHSHCIIRRGSRGHHSCIQSLHSRSHPLGPRPVHDQNHHVDENVPDMVGDWVGQQGDSRPGPGGCPKDEKRRQGADECEASPASGNL